jgi:hypothetical protein
MFVYSKLLPHVQILSYTFLESLYLACQTSSLFAHSTAIVGGAQLEGFEQEYQDCLHLAFASWLSDQFEVESKRAFMTFPFGLERGVVE